MQTTNLVRAPGDRAHLRDIERRGIAQDQRFWLEELIKRGEETQLFFHLLQHNLDHQVAVGKVGQLQRTMQAGHILLDLLWREFAFAGHRFPGVVNTPQAFVQQGLIYFKHEHVIADLCAGLGNAAAHQSTAHNANFTNRH